MFKRSLILILIFLVLIASIISFQVPVIVDADESAETLFAQINTSMNRSADYNTMAAIYGALKTSGFNDYECAAILVNMNRESSMRPDAKQNESSWSGGVGLIQWDDRKDKLELWSKSNCTHGLIDMQGGHKIGCMGCQVAYILHELNNDNQWGGKAPSGYSIDVATAQADCGTGVDLTQKVELSTWRSMQDPVAQSLYFTSQFERCAYGIDIYKQGAKQSKDMYKVLTGTDPITGASSGSGTNPGDADEKVAGSIANSLYQTGYWSEDQLSAYCKLTEINIQSEFLDAATREALTQDELSGLANWQLNVKMREEEHGFIRFLRTLSMFIGILLIIWAMLFYTAYWIDRTNSVIPIEFVFLLSLGKLRISGDENDSTYSFNTNSTAKVKMINHRNCIFICFIAVGFGFLLITGIFYLVVQGFVNKALQLLGRV